MPEELYMQRAIRLARLGLGRTSPNPMVGAVIVKNGRIIGEGFHQYCGGPHAERSALASCTEDPAGAAMYVTLEPCCHQGRTPPCTDAILANGIAHVVIGSRDPNPKAAGGADILRRNGITVTEHFLQDECDAVNEVFFRNGSPAMRPGSMSTVCAAGTPGSWPGSARCSRTILCSTAEHRNEDPDRRSGFRPSKILCRQMARLPRMSLYPIRASPSVSFATLS